MGELLPAGRALVESGAAAGRTRLRGRSAGYRQPDRMRGRIQTGMLITRLHRITKGLVPGSPPQLMVQVAAAKVLLAKSLPDLQTVELTGDADRPLVILTRME